MSNKINSPSQKLNSSDVITSEAASWLAQIDSGALSEPDKLALAEWMSRSPRHRAELRRVEHMWGGVDVLIDQSLLTSRPSISLLNVVSAWAQLRPIKVGAVCLFLVCTTFFALAWLSVEPDAEPVTVESATERSFTYQAPRGQTRVLPLADGSVMYLNSNGIAEVRYTENERQIRLLNGEAMFDVTKDPRRPFRVYAGGGRVEAIGTLFIIKLVDNDLELTVSEGQVRLDNTSFNAATRPHSESVKTNLQEVLVNDGERVLSKNMHAIVKVDDHDIARYTAWVQGMQIFQGDTLKYIVEEVSRHSAKQIVIADPVLGKLRMGGVFELGAVDKLLSTLVESLDVRVTQVDENLIYIEPKQRQ